MATEQAGTTVAGQARAPGQMARLRGWKEIGRFFGVDERTVKRWEAQRGLPVHRVPGEARAPVFAYADELRAWMDRDRAGIAPAGGAVGASHAEAPDPAAAWRSRAGLLIGIILLLGVGLAGWLGVQMQAERQAAEARLADVRQLAQAQVAAISDQLERQPGPLQLRAGLVKEAATVLGRVAALPDASPDLRREAAEAWRRLAIVENAVDRPSLRDRAAAQAALARGLALIAGDSSAPGAALRARLQIEAARQAATSGASDEARRLLAAAAPVATADRGPLADEYWLARSESLGWDGAYAEARASAERVRQGHAASPTVLLTQVRALDLGAEALFYAGDLAGALAGYRRAEAAAAAGLARWPADRRMQWALRRQQWNVGSTLIDLRRPAEAVAALARSRAGWAVMAAADPADQALASWVRTTRMSHALALGAAGQRGAAIAELSVAVAERRQWLAAASGDAERQRALVKGLAALGDVLAPAGRVGEACALYAEAFVLAERMATRGTLTGNDRTGMLALLRQSDQRHCR